MFRKYVCLILCAVTVLTLCSCSSLLEDTYVSSSPHRSSPASGDVPDTETVTASSYTELCAALSAMVDSHTENGIIRFDSYNGDLSSDLSKACIHISNNTPLGAYSVKHINSALNKIVSYYEADILITYKKTAEDVAKIRSVSTESDIAAELLSAVSDFAASLTVRTSNGTFNTERISGIVSGLYYSAPEDILYLPQITATAYPSEGDDRILEIVFQYPFSSAILKERSAALSQRADEIIGDMGNLSGNAALEYLCETLDRIVEFDQSSADTDEYNRWLSFYTAYGPLVLGKAGGEGYAMAMKLLCDRSGIECLVVRGRLNNVSHAWNIVRLDNGSYCHLDVSRYNGSALFRSDSEMTAAQYWWDPSLYVPSGSVSQNTSAASFASEPS